MTQKQVGATAMRRVTHLHGDVVLFIAVAVLAADVTAVIVVAGPVGSSDHDLLASGAAIGYAVVASVEGRHGCDGWRRVLHTSQLRM